MARIDKSLESISKDVREIISMFLDDKKAKNKAILVSIPISEIISIL